MILGLCCYVQYPSFAATAIANTPKKSVNSPKFSRENVRDNITNDSPRNAQESFFQKTNAFENLHAKFTQILNNPNQDQAQTSEGELWITKPSFFKWVTSNPNKQTIVSDGQKLWIYDEDLAQITVQNVPENIAQAPYLLFLTGNSETLIKLFSVNEIGKNSYRLTPKDKEQSLIKYVDIVFSGKRLTKLLIQTDMGQSTHIDFSKQSFSKIALSTYTFKPPEGVDILGDSA